MADQKEKPVHDGLPEMLSIDNMAKGAVYEMCNEAIKQLAANVADPNTEPTQKRKIVLEITASPYKDRSGGVYTAKISTKLAGLRPAEDSMYFAKRGGEHLAFGRNTKQEEIQFDVADTPSATKPKLN